MLNRIVLFLLAGLVLLLAVYLIIGPARVWRLAGEPDLGEVDFATLQRRPYPNDALVCPAGACAARRDAESPVFTMSASVLRGRFLKAIAAELRLERVDGGQDPLALRFIQRSRVMAFPDTVNVRFVDVGGGASSVMLYSRSQLGRDDYGVNGERIARWLALLAQEMAGG